ncbi:hypothetical protein M378DRAFT_172051 [Amanita muscaria Koide BX008]|uniref:A-kinase anchor protein 7-like phosphoesterase domain-containing protein n=1 Tax=Amanita muscaria (strain Koide BX008) TaxID=946122 RepID=A0A0C2WLV5_AMAMK|nr:hypothetical protein M378DRAFT_172051 [Amanita muscaria Koide BX008]
MACREEGKTVQAALDLLHTLRPSISEILNGSPSVKVRLDTMDVLKSNNVEGNVNAHVLFLGPRGVHEEDKRLWNVCNLINQSFRSAGFVTDTRPLKLHCTILNTSHRRPRGNIPFSYSDILASDVGRNVLVPAPASGTTARAVNFGTYDVGRVELWEMGSHGHNNEYVSCGGIGF